MAQSALPTLKTGLSHFRKNSQLWWTLSLAVIIFMSFVFIANLFISIAQDAQDRLINVRIGSIQDTLVQYVDEDSNPIKLQESIENIATQNQTIREFRIVSTEGEEDVVLASLNTEEIGNTIESNNFLIQQGIFNEKESTTIENFDSEERFYFTVRGFTNSEGEVIGYIETKQTLSQADLAINENIRTSILVFILILMLVMYLFFRHAKIVDYISLYRQLKEVDNLKDDFISMASHELKTPLTVIRGYTEFISEARELSEKNREYAKRIDLSAKQLTQLVEEMLDVSRIEQDRMKFEMSEFNLNDFLKELLKTFDVQAKEKGLELKFEEEGDTEHLIKSDKNKLRQAFVNIIGNSIKYTNEGEVKVYINTEKDKFIEIRVSDTGIGMTKEEQEKLFTKFYRVQNSETEEISGTGLGLWITKQIIQKLGGKLSVESIKGKGTDFVVKFKIS